MEAAGIEVLRDLHEVDFGDSLTDFMKELGTLEHLCIFLSEKYLESPYCMYELLTAWRKAGGGKRTLAGLRSFRALGSTTECPQAKAWG